MHNILITKDVAYGAGSAGTVTIANLPTLNHGAISIVGDGNLVLAGDGSNAQGVESFQILVGITKDPVKKTGLQNSVTIFTKYVTKINVEKYNEPVTQRVEIGPFTAAAGNAQGELGLVLNNNSYVRTIQTEQIRISEWKKAGDTLQSVLQKIVDRINNGTGLPRNSMYQSFTTASLVGTGDAAKIQLEMKSESVDFTMSSYALAESVVVTTTRKAVLSKGKGADVRRAEDEYSGNLGNAGYGWRNELYYSKPLEADPNGKYDIISIQFTGMHDTPQNKVRAASNWIQIAIPTGSALTASLQTLFATMIPSYKPSKDQDNETDGDPNGPAGTDPGAQE